MPSTSGANSSWVWCEKRTLGGRGGVCGAVLHMCTINSGSGPSWYHFGTI